MDKRQRESVPELIKFHYDDYGRIVTDKPSEGIKFDTDKLRMDLVPPEAIESLARVLGYGAKKYDDRGWEKGIKYSRLYAATLRHLLAWAKGQHYDTESNIRHLEHALCNLAFMVTYEYREMDDTWDDVT